MQSQIGPYKVEGEVGRGGMGVVYRAIDARLDRAVAIKALPEEMASDAGRLERFEREAKVLAQLNHPNVAGIHGIEEQDGAKYLVLEFVEGETLAERLDRGPLDVDDAIELAVQIAAGVEAAHEAGVIHRDLKPANIKVTPEGVAKVLDFGLAKSDEGSTSSTGSGFSQSPTMTTPQHPQHSPTIEGAILGTAAYMSPEQARGRRVDKRTDIWSFGVVLYEMLCGASPFYGETATDSIGAVLHKDLDLGRLPSETPAGVRRVLGRCVERDKNLRYRDIGDVRIELLDQSAKDDTQSGQSTAWTGRSRGVTIVLALIFGSVITGGVFSLTRLQPERDEVRRSVLPMRGELGGDPSSPKISPDGSAVVFVKDGSLWLQSLDEFEPHRLEGTDSGMSPFWSPDSQWIGFGQGPRLMKIPVHGGVSQQIASLPNEMSTAAGAAWLDDGTIVLTTGNTSLLSVSSLGGTLSEWLGVDPGNEVDFHDASALPNGRGVLFTVHTRRGGWSIGVSDGTTRTVVVVPEDTRPRKPVYVEPGYVLFDRDGSNPGVWAVPFSLEGLEATGEPFLVARGGAMSSGSDDGTLVYLTGVAGLEFKMGWVPIDGSPSVLFGELQPSLNAPDVSPDGGRVVYKGGMMSDSALWVEDFSTGSRTRITYGEPHVGEPKWTVDGSEIAGVDESVIPARIKFYAADGSGAVDGSMEGREIEFGPDGLTAVVTRDGDVESNRDLWLVSLDEGGEDRPLLATPADEHDPRVSPDGKWLLYSSDESGINQVYLTRFPEGKGKWQVSTIGAGLGSWGSVSDRIYYLSFAGSLMEVEFDTSVGVRFEAPVERFRTTDVGSVWFRGMVTDAAEDRVLAVFRADSLGGEVGIGVVENWFEEFRDR